VLFVVVLPAGIFLAKLRTIKINRWPDTSVAREIYFGNHVDRDAVDGYRFHVFHAANGAASQTVIDQVEPQASL